MPSISPPLKYWYDRQGRYLGSSLPGEPIPPGWDWRAEDKRRERQRRQAEETRQREVKTAEIDPSWLPTNTVFYVKGQQDRRVPIEVDKGTRLPPQQFIPQAGLELQPDYWIDPAFEGEQIAQQQQERARFQQIFNPSPEQSAIAAVTNFFQSRGEAPPGIFSKFTPTDRLIR